jgi:CheY-like chemotaxis protein
MIAYYFPTKVILLDDNESFLRAIQENLKYNSFKIETHVNPNKVKNILCNGNLSKFNDNVFKETDGILLGDRAINVNLSNIIKLHSLGKETAHVSVLVIDNEMPQIKGLEFLKQLENKDVYRILLTGQVNDQQVISAFNKGLIDSYINKADINLSDKLLIAINAGIKKYFSKFSILIQQVIESDRSRPTALSDIHFEEFFFTIVRKKNIKEYYLIDAQGSYLMIDKLGNKYTLLILDHKNSLAHLDVLQENGIEEYISNKVILKKIMLYCYSSETKETKFFELDKKIPNLDGFMYRIYDGDILKLLR